MAAFSNPKAYETWMGRWSRRLAPAFVRFAGPLEGARLLDIGSGTGVLSSALLNTVSDGRVVGVEPAHDFVAYCRDSIRDPRARFMVGDAQALPFADNGFDGAFALLILQELPDPPLAVREMRRVTRPGGLVCTSQWDFGRGMPMLAIFWDAVREVTGSAAARRAADAVLNVAYPRGPELRTLWQDCGLVKTEIERHEVEMTFASFDDYWRPFLSNASPSSSFASTLDGGERNAIERRLRQKILGGKEDGPFTLLAQAWAVRGEVPVQSLETK